MITTFAACFWQPNEASFDFSRCYDETWVEKLYRGVERSVGGEPFRFVCYSDRERLYAEDIIQERIEGKPDYTALLQPLEREEGPVIVLGLDTIITGSLRPFLKYARETTRFAVPRDPIFTNTVCNALMIKGPQSIQNAGTIWERAKATGNDMEAMRWLYKEGLVDVIDDMWPGSVASYREHLYKEGRGPEREALVYFHGRYKPHEIAYREQWIRDYWL